MQMCQPSSMRSLMQSINLKNLKKNGGQKESKGECSRKLYGIKVMPHTRVAQYNTRLLDKDEGGSG